MGYELDELSQLQSMNREREYMGVTWKYYICYILEVDELDVNEDALQQLAEVLEDASLHMT